MEPDGGGKWLLWRWFSIMKGAEEYLVRLTVIRTPWFQILVHWIYLPDQDRAVHDHPWAFCGIVLRGGYHEVVGKRTMNETVCGYWMTMGRRTVRHFIYKNSWTAHKIVSLIGRKPTITLLLTGPTVKSWGFYSKAPNRKMIFDLGVVPVVYTPWRQYLNEQKHEQAHITADE